MKRSWVVSAHYRLVIDALTSARVGKGLSQRELARRLGKHPSFVNKIEQQERRMDVLEFMAIADALGIDLLALTASIRKALPERIDLS